MSAFMDQLFKVAAQVVDLLHIIAVRNRWVLSHSEVCNKLSYNLFEIQNLGT